MAAVVSKKLDKDKVDKTLDWDRAVVEGGRPNERDARCVGGHHCDRENSRRANQHMVKYVCRLCEREVLYIPKVGSSAAYRKEPAAAPARNATKADEAVGNGANKQIEKRALKFKLNSGTTSSDSNDEWSQVSELESVGRAPTWDGDLETFERHERELQAFVEKKKSLIALRGALGASDEGQRPRRTREDTTTSSSRGKARANGCSGAATSDC